MLRISKIMDYGALVLTHMARRPQQVFSTADLAACLSLGQPTVSKVLKSLGRHDLVKSSRGPQGGYTLGRPAKEISIAQVIDALEDQPFGLTECSATPGVCSFEADCQLRVNWQRINAMVRRTLEEVSIADMASPIPLESFLHARPAPDAGSGIKAANLTTWSLGK